MDDLDGLDDLDEGTKSRVNTGLDASPLGIWTVWTIWTRDSRPSDDLDVALTYAPISRAPER